MGKRDKKQKHQKRNSRQASFNFTGEDEREFDSGHESYPLSLPNSAHSEDEENEEEDKDNDGLQENGESDEYPLTETPSKFLLYQQSVQSPKGDISYLQKFFILYVGGRFPLHFQEDFCGTALLSTEWLRTDSRRTAVGLDLDLEALNWCMENNICKVGADGYSRISLFHGNVLHPHDAKLVKFQPEELVRNVSLEERKNFSMTGSLESSIAAEESTSSDDNKHLGCSPLPARDIVCAFNYSCCCLHSRADLVLYFKHAHDALSKKGGIFVMDLYGGTSSEQKLRLQRKFSNFTYVWEQAEFDIIGRKTRISLHFHFKEQQKIRHAFSYDWRLWSLPEIKDCLEEAGFRSVHFWLRQMPDIGDTRSTVGFGAGRDVKYEEVKSFEQHDAWNAYIVGVA